MHHQDHQVGIGMCNEVEKISEKDTRPNRCHKSNQELECRHSGVRHQTDYWRLPRTNEYTKADYRIVRASAIRLPLCMRVPNCAQLCERLKPGLRFFERSVPPLHRPVHRPAGLGLGLRVGQRSYTALHGPRVLRWPAVTDSEALVCSGSRCSSP
jgi:hypothetical protein